MGLLDVLTGGKSSAASDAAKKAMEMFANVYLPTKADLTLPELEKYVQQGLLTPAQAQAVLQKQNAYDTTAVPTEGRNAQIAALNQLQDIANAKGMDATAQAQTQQTLNALNTNMQGQRGAILDSFAQRGVPLSLASEAMQNQVLGQDAQAANANALQANADAQMRALQALQGSANVGANVQSQDWNQANTKAAAQNAINQWNSQVANAANEANAARQQQAGAYNTGVKQDISNQNVGLGNYRTQYNTQVPQQVFSNAMQKASGQAGAYQNMANLAQTQGGQQYGMFKDIANAASGLISAGAGAAGKMGGSGVGAPAGYKAPNVSYDQVMGSGPVMYSKGGIVPGHARNPGDNPANDTVPVRLSPGELVVPRSMVKDFVGNLPKKSGSAHPDDVKSVLKALSELREKEIESDDSAWSGGCTKGMADGGIVRQPSDFLNFTPPAKPEIPALNVPRLNDVAKAAPAPREASQIAPVAGANANPMGDYLSSLRSKVDEYGPDKQRAVADFLMKQQGSFGNRLGQALANFGGTGAQYSEANQRALENAMKIGKEYNEGKLGQLESGMKIDMMDPNSPISKQLQNTYRDLIVTNFKYPANTVDKIPASEIPRLVASLNEKYGKEAELAIKQYEAEENIGIKRDALEAGKAESLKKGEREESEGRREAAESILKDKSWSFLGFPTGLGGSSLKNKALARAELAGRLKPDEDETKAAAGPLGETTTKNGVLYKWSPTTRKYHKVQQ